MVAADLIRGVAVGTARAADADAARWRSGTSSRCARSTAPATAFFNPAFDAIVPDLRPESRPRAGERARPARAADRVPAGRAGARRLARRRASAPARRSRSTRPRSSSRRRPIGSMRYRRPDGAHSAGVDRARDPGGLRVRPRTRLAVGDARVGGVRLPRVHGPGRGPAAVRGQERSRRERLRARPGVRRRAASARSSAPSSAADAGCRDGTSPACTSSGPLATVVGRRLRARAGERGS